MKHFIAVAWSCFLVACGDTARIAPGLTSDGSVPDVAVIEASVEVPALDDVGPRLDVAAAFDVTMKTDTSVSDVVDVPPPDVAIADASADRETAPDVTLECPQPVACNALVPTTGPNIAWRHLSTRLTVALGSARHRGRDLLLREGDAQWALAKFAYGLNDDDLNDEDVELWLLRDCMRWERLGITRTTIDASPHATVEGVEDNGGRVYFQIPAAQRLGRGWHRVHFVVRGDGTTATQWIRVVGPDARIAVSDVDGTLTENENAAFVALLTGPPPMANAGAPDVMRALINRGYEVMYLTARPEWLAQGTHQWLSLRGFPRGIVHTTLGITGALGAAAADFKTAELLALRMRFGRAPDYGFGNTDSDVTAYVRAGVASAFYYRFSGDLRGGSRVDDYNLLVPRIRALAPLCR